MTVIAIDPGYAKRGSGCACALFVGRELHATWFTRPGRPAPAVPDGTHVVWECPTIRPKEDVSPGKANTLIRLAAEGAALAGRYAGQCGAPVCLAVLPATWKGSTPKPVNHGRIIAELTESELARVGDVADIRARITAAKRAGGLDRWSKAGHVYYGTWQTHNLLDAVGIGRWYLEQRA